jgi:hypothetical protein
MGRIFGMERSLCGLFQTQFCFLRKKQSPLKEKTNSFTQTL